MNTRLIFLLLILVGVGYYICSRSSISAGKVRRKKSKKTRPYRSRIRQMGLPPPSEFTKSFDVLVRMTTFQRLKMGQWLCHSEATNDLTFQNISTVSDTREEDYKSYWQITGGTIKREFNDAPGHAQMVTVYFVQTYDPRPSLSFFGRGGQALQYCGGVNACTAQAKFDPDQAIVFMWANTSDPSLYQPPGAIPSADIRGYPVANMLALRGGQYTDVRLFVSLDDPRNQLVAVGYPEGAVAKRSSLQPGPILARDSALWVFQPIRK